MNEVNKQNCAFTCKQARPLFSFISVNIGCLTTVGRPLTKSHRLIHQQSSPGVLRLNGIFLQPQSVERMRWCFVLRTSMAVLEVSRPCSSIWPARMAQPAILAQERTTARKLVNELTKFSHQVVVASLSTGINTITGEELAQALVGAHVVINVANVPFRKVGDLGRL